MHDIQTIIKRNKEAVADYRNISEYLNKPIRTLEQAKLDREKSRRQERQRSPKNTWEWMA